MSYFYARYDEQQTNRQKKRPGRFRLPGLGKWLWQSRALKLPLRRNKVQFNTSLQLTFLPL
ncbi:MAG TPA: hypothetical protein DD649_08560 [Providencia sp.]|nr:hypothetical protein [Providencia sp.]